MVAIRYSLLLLPLLTFLACEDGRAPAPDVSAPLPLTLRLPFELYGVPGPWWRDDATQTQFDHDMWACRTESKQARAAAPPDARKDIAYRAFLDCMTDSEWTRGFPPPLPS